MTEGGTAVPRGSIVSVRIASPAMERVRAIERHVPSERAPLRVVAGEYVTAGERDTDWPAFVLVSADSGSGWVPSRYLSGESGRVEVLVPYDTTELATEAGDILEVVERDDESGWLWCRDQAGREGWVPARRVEAQARSL